MKRPRTSRTAALLLALCGGCASTDHAPTPAAPPAGAGPAAAAPAAGAPDASAADDAPTPAEPAEPAAPRAVPAAYRADRVPADELAIWSDPRYKRWFIESYIAETEIEPGVTVNERDVMEEVLEFISEDKLDKAIKLLQRNRDEADSAVFDYTMGSLHVQREELEEAVAAYRIAVQKYPKFRRAWRHLGLTHVRMGEFEQALPALTRVVELGGGDALTYGLLGYAYISVDNSLAAESAYRMAILLDPATTDWKLGLARSLFKQERFDDAAALCETLIDEDPANTDYWMLQANAFIGLKRPLRAAENFEFVEQLGGSTPESLNLLGDIYVNQDMVDLAGDAYLRAMELAPTADPARALRAAKVLTARGALDVTERLIDTIEAQQEDQLDDAQRKQILHLRARIAVARGATGEEVRVLEQIVELDPLDGDALILLGQHAGRQGDVEQAIFYFERAEGLEQFEADAKVRHGQLLVGQGRYEEALGLLKSAQQKSPRDTVQQYIEQVERVARAR